MKITVPELMKKKPKAEPIVMVSSYDATFARMADDAGVDIILVGDSLGMLVQGHGNTLSVTLDEIIYHTQAVKRGARKAHIVADMPFMSYQASRRDALVNAGRLLKEGGAEAIKLEGGVVIAETVSALVDAGIPVMGHVGLEPQRVHHYGGYKIQGNSREAAERIAEDAKALVAAGVYSLVLEGMPQALAKIITATIPVPTIGIASGPDCDGQVLVAYDLLGFSPEFQPKFVKRYCEGYTLVTEALGRFASEVRHRKFPGKGNTPK